MSRQIVRRLVESIIFMPTPEAAARHAQANQTCLLDSGFRSGLLGMTQAELARNGHSRRFVALNRLAEYAGSLLGVGAAPELVVITPENAALPAETFAETQNEDLRPSSFDAWVKHLDPTGSIRSELNVDRFRPARPADAAWRDLNRGNADGAMRRLQMQLDSTTPSSLEHVTCLVELGELYSQLGEDIVATEYLDRAEASFDARDNSNPSGVDLAAALRATLLGRSPSYDQSPLGISMASRDLYRRLYTARERIYRRRGLLALAAREQAKLESMDGAIRDGSSVNLDFSRAMLDTFASSDKFRAFMAELERTDV